MAITSSKLIVGTPFQQVFIDPVTALPMIGTVTFYVTGTTTLKNVYIASGDPTDPYVASPNPITLNAAGAITTPILYYPYDEADNTTEQLYDIIVQDSDSVTQISVTGWPYSQQVNSSSSSSDVEYIPGGQFQYPIQFYDPNYQNVGILSQQNTGVAFGWQYFTDAPIDTDNTVQRYVTFSNISSIDLEGNPLNEIQILSEDIEQETYSVLSTFSLGPCNMLAGDDITISFQGYCSSGSNSISLSIYRDYGAEGASAPDTLSVDTVDLTSNREKYSLNYSVPTVSGKSIVGTGGFYLYINLPLGATYSISLTNISLKVGTFTDPVYAETNGAEEAGKLIGQTMPLTDDDDYPMSLYQNYNFVNYLNGYFTTYALTGTYALVDIDNVLPFMLPLTSTVQFLSTNGYSDTGIPYRRLYNVLGNKWGTSGTLTVSASGSSLIFQANAGSRAHSAYTIGITGFSLSEDDIGLDYGFSVSVTGNVATFTSVDHYTGSTVNPGFSVITDTGLPYEYKTTWGTQTDNYTNATPPLPPGIIGNTSDIDAALGSGYVPPDYPFSVNPSIPIPYKGDNTMVEADVTAGSPSASWVATVTFSDVDISYFKSSIYNVTLPGLEIGNLTANLIVYKNHLQFPTSSNNSKGTLAGCTWTYRGNENVYFTPTAAPIVMGFTVDGIGDLYTGEGTTTITVPFSSTIGNISANLAQVLAPRVNIPFKYTFTCSAVSANDYFLFSDNVTDYYGWYKVNGVGTDPAISGRTGVEIDLTTAEAGDPISVATISASSINSFTFNVPSYTDVNLTPVSNKTVAVVYL